MKLAIIIPLFKGQRYMQELIQTLDQQTFKKIKIFAVDNNPHDGTSDILEQECIKHKIDYQILSKGLNLGFAKAVNLGIKTAISQNYNYFVLLNQDVILSNQVLEQCTHILESQDYRAVVPKILNSNNTIWWVGTHILNPWQIIVSLNYKISTHVLVNKKYTQKRAQTLEKEEVQTVEAVTGCALFITKDVIEKTGYLDESYFMYGEDLDYSLRLRKAGYELGLVTSATLYHRDQYKLDSKSLVDHIKSMKKYYIYLRSCFIFLYKHYTPLVALIWLIKLPITIPLQYVLMKIKS